MKAKEIADAKSDVLRKRLKDLQWSINEIKRVEKVEFEVGFKTKTILSALEKGKPELKKEVDKGTLFIEDAARKATFMFDREERLIILELKRRGELS